MCGVLAVLTSKNNQEALQQTEKMLVPLRESRGPDAGKVVEVSTQSLHSDLYFAHARLSIIDLSESANQPMTDEEGGISLTYNGEIYNYLELRQELKNHYFFKTQSDTEVLLAALKVWGLEKTLQRLRGMFAFVAYHREKNELWAARDVAGEKPLSFGRVGEDFILTSDLRVLKEHPLWQKKVSLAQLKNYFDFRFITHPQSIFKDFEKLSPGHFFKLSLSENSSPEVRPYWDIWQAWEQPEEQETTDVWRAMKSSIEKVALTSDAPVGCFLSGGIDSALVAAVASRARNKDLRAYTVRFTESDYDESVEAAQVAKALGVPHQIVPFAVDDFKKSFDEMIPFLDEPMAVHSFYPLGLLAKTAKQDVKVCLSGDGGDELFAGYNRHQFWNRYGNLLKQSPTFLKELLAKGLSSSLAQEKAGKLLESLGQKQGQNKIEKISFALKSKDLSSFYSQILKQKENPLGVSKGLSPFKSPSSSLLSEVEKMMAMDFAYYLPCDVLNKVDRATMAYGLEARAPLLDRDLVEKAGGLPLSEKMGPGAGKLFMKEQLKELLPELNFQRAKSGFTTPLPFWRKNLFDDQFFSRLRQSVLFEHLDPIYLKKLEEGQFEGEEGFCLYSLVYWLESHELTIDS